MIGGDVMALRVDHGPIPEDIVNDLTDEEKAWLTAWNRQGEIPGGDGAPALDPLDPNNRKADATGLEDGEPGKYDGLTIEDLKDELRERNLPVSGNKQDLIDRLVEDDESDDEDDEDGDGDDDA